MMQCKHQSFVRNKSKSKIQNHATRNDEGDITSRYMLSITTHLLTSRMLYPKAYAAVRKMMV